MLWEFEINNVPPLTPPTRMGTIYDDGRPYDYVVQFENGEYGYYTSQDAINTYTYPAGETFTSTIYGSVQSIGAPNNTYGMREVVTDMEVDMSGRTEQSYVNAIGMNNLNSFELNNANIDNVSFSHSNNGMAQLEVSLNDFSSSSTDGMNNFVENSSIHSLGMENADFSEINDLSNGLLTTASASSIQSININGMDISSATQVNGIFSGAVNANSVTMNNVNSVL